MTRIDTVIGFFNRSEELTKMRDYSERVPAYRQRAEKLRTIAQSLMGEANRTELLRIADDFDRLAEVHEERAALRP